MITKVLGFLQTPMVGIDGSCIGTVRKTNEWTYSNMDHDTISMVHGQHAVIANNLCENLVKPDDGKPLWDSLKML